MTSALTPSTRWINVSAFFTSEAAVAKTQHELLRRGIPRDLVEIVVSSELAGQYYVSSKKRRLSRMVSDAARGALTGLILFSFISLILIMTAFSYEDDDPLLLVMILGPNMGVLAGGIVGLVTGLIRRPELPKRFHRVHEGHGILVVVRSKEESEASAILHTLKDQGGQHAIIEE